MVIERVTDRKTGQDVEMTQDEVDRLAGRLATELGE
jgi:hypothetical protein